jgi:TRAP-type C4-dicarboxylate transport system permease small subunit
MDLVLQMLGERTQRVLRLVGYVVFIAVSLLIIYQAPGSISQFTHHSQIAGLPMDIVHSVIPVSFALIVIALVRLAIDDFRNLTQGNERPAAMSDKPR